MPAPAVRGPPRARGGAGAPRRAAVRRAYRAARAGHSRRASGSDVDEREFRESRCIARRWTSPVSSRTATRTSSRTTFARNTRTSASTSSSPRWGRRSTSCLPMAPRCIPVRRSSSVGLTGETSAPDDSPPTSPACSSNASSRRRSSWRSGYIPAPRDVVVVAGSSDFDHRLVDQAKSGVPGGPAPGPDQVPGRAAVARSPRHARAPSAADGRAVLHDVRRRHR